MLVGRRTLGVGRTRLLRAKDDQIRIGRDASTWGSTRPVVSRLRDSSLAKRPSPRFTATADFGRNSASTPRSSRPLVARRDQVGRLPGPMRRSQATRSGSPTATRSRTTVDRLLARPFATRSEQEEARAIQTRSSPRLPRTGPGSIPIQGPRPGSRAWMPCVRERARERTPETLLYLLTLLQARSDRGKGSLRAALRGEEMTVDTDALERALRAWRSRARPSAVERLVLARGDRLRPRRLLLTALLAERGGTPRKRSPGSNAPAGSMGHASAHSRPSLACSAGLGHVDDAHLYVRSRLWRRRKVGHARSHPGRCGCNSTAETERLPSTTILICSRSHNPTWSSRRMRKW